MKNRGFLLRYLGVLSGVLGIALVVHALARKVKGLAWDGDLLIASYAVNLLLAFAIVFFIYALRRRMQAQIGFLFMGGSFLKFLLFFLLFYPSFTSDDHISRAEFGSFFVPYALALILETVFASRLLRNLEKETPLRDPPEAPQNKV
jgi:hypothetical protein